MDFDEATKLVAANPSAFSQQTLLRLYALYKVATVGPCNVPSPGFFAFEARAKWDAWNNLGSSHTPEMARLKYAELVEERFDFGYETSSSTRSSIYNNTDGDDGALGFTVSTLEKPDESALVVKEDDEKLLLDWVQTGDVSLLDAFLKKNPTIDLDQGRPDDGVTALHWACDREWKPIVELLVANGANLNVQDQEGMTALHYASLTENRDIYDFLIQAGADPSIRDISGELPSLKQ
ncbi:ankyrin [Rhizoclosmatium globosum]|uniref:Ankyrin n=1 Tax=Rhizoclosmatium globosum TaxID=329046 RepID=A0A1Y2BW74_9FUNG|nr:ankyrin [Rhizoclosmatium globosum]|eukprot:ORY39010.1 ankyrin [Rhizoclosmatium globosum]